MSEKTYNIIAGINGAGKTSLYSVISKEYDLGQRVNIDELVKAQGDWTDTLLQIKSGRTAMRLINEYIEKGITFHQETTLPGVTITKFVRKAKQEGYKINLFFVGIDDVEIAINRVHKRIKSGGHGIDDRIILKRYQKLPVNLKLLLPLCDTVIIYDNTIRFRQVAMIIDNKLADYDKIMPEWLNDLLKECKYI